MLGWPFWAIGYVCWSTINIADEMADKYLEHHRKPEDFENWNFILE
jgi:putative transposase